MWEEGGDGGDGRDVGDGGQQQRAGLGAVVVRRGQRDDYVVLVPHVEGVVGEGMDGRRVAGDHALRVVLRLLVFVASRTQHAL